MKPDGAERDPFMEESMSASLPVDQALRESEARTRAILDAAVDAIITIDDRGVIESVNPAAERLFGHSSAEMIGQNVRMLMPSPYREEHDTYLRNYLETGQKKIIGIGREVEGLRKDLSTFPMHLAVSELWIGERRMFTGIARDTTAGQRSADARDPRCRGGRDHHDR
jgi:two-component system, LuxR family, sensor kinase FixL